MTTVAAIAALAFTKVHAKITDVIRSSTLTKTVNGAYNLDTGAYAVTQTTHTCRSVEATANAVQDIFPDYVFGPSDRILFVEGLAVVPSEGDDLDGRAVLAVGDIAGAGSFFAMIVR